MGNNKNQIKIRDGIYGEISARYVERYGAVLRRELAMSKAPTGDAADDYKDEGHKNIAPVDAQLSEASDHSGGTEDDIAENGIKSGGGDGWSELGADAARHAEKDAVENEKGVSVNGKDAPANDKDASKGEKDASGFEKDAPKGEEDASGFEKISGEGSSQNDGPVRDEEHSQAEGSAPQKRRSAIRPPDDESQQRTPKAQPGHKLMTPGAEIDDRIMRGLTSERRKTGFYRFFLFAAIVLILTLTITTTGLPSMLAAWWSSLYDRITAMGEDEKTPSQTRPDTTVTGSRPAGSGASNSEIDETGPERTPEDTIIPINIAIKPAYSVVSTVYDSGRTIYFITNTRQDNIVLSLRRGGITKVETEGLTPVAFGETTAYMAYDADYSVMVYEREGIVHELTCRFDVNTLVDFCGFERRDFARGVLYPQHTVGGAWLVSERSLSNIPLRSDKASYADIRRHISGGGVPPAGAVATEEVLNFFPAENAMPGADTFSVRYEIGPSPFDGDRALAYIRIKAPDIDIDDFPPSSVTFLINTSSSMFSFDKLPLLKDAILGMAEISGGRDRISVVTYDGGSEILLDNARSDDTAVIRSTLDGLTVGGNSGPETGIELAYSIALKNFLNGGNNLVIAITDENDNLGLDNGDELDALVARNRSGGVDLSVLGIGALNGWGDAYQQDGNTPGQWRFTRANTLTKTVAAILNELTLQSYITAGNVVAQIEFNPHNVEDYNLIGYENRLSRNQDKLYSLGDTYNVYAGEEIILLYEIKFAQPVVTGETRGAGAAATTTSPAARAAETTPGATAGEANGGEDNADGTDGAETGLDGGEENADETDGGDGTGDGAVGNASAGTEPASTVAATAAPEPEDAEQDMFADELFELRVKYTGAGETRERIFAGAATFGDYTEDNSTDYFLACSVAAFCGILEGDNRLDATLEIAEELAGAAVGDNADGLRSAYLNMVKQYRGIIED